MSDATAAAHVAVFEFENWLQSNELSNPEGTEAREHLVGVIERAILAERERGAGIIEQEAAAQRQLSKRHVGGGPEFRAKMLDRLAAAIRKGGE